LKKEEEVKVIELVLFQIQYIVEVLEFVVEGFQV
jgi:hypothetical protein